MQLAQAVGIDPKQVNFVPYDGGGDLLPAILGDKIDVRPPPVSASSRTRSPPATSGCWPSAATSGSRASTPRPSRSPASTWSSPTGAASWRPPGISDAAEGRGWSTPSQKMHADPEWKDALEANSWTDAFLTGDEFATFLTEQDKRVADTLSELGLA